MPTFPPSIDWPKFDQAKMKHLADAFRAATHLGSDFLNTGATYIHPQIVNTLRHYGLDGTNRLGFGSDARKAANKVTAQMKQAAEHLVEAGNRMGMAYQIFMQEVWVPIEQAKAAQKNGRNETLNV